MVASTSTQHEDNESVQVIFQYQVDNSFVTDRLNRCQVFFLNNQPNYFFYCVCNRCLSLV